MNKGLEQIENLFNNYKNLAENSNEPITADIIRNNTDNNNQFISLKTEAYKQSLFTYLADYLNNNKDNLNNINFIDFLNYVIQLSFIESNETNKELQELKNDLSNLYLKTEPDIVELDAKIERIKNSSEISYDDKKEFIDNYEEKKQILETDFLKMLEINI